VPHLDEGTLSAWLDGQLDPNSDGEGRALARHLDECPRCRALLEAERIARERATSILAESDLPVPAAPAFGSIRQGAAASTGGTGRRVPRMGLAWAASIAVAVSAGLLARELSERRGLELPASVEYENEVPQGAPGVEEASAKAEALESRSRQDVAPPPARREKSAAPAPQADAVAAEAPVAGRFAAEPAEGGASAAAGCWRMVNGKLAAGIPVSFGLKLDPAPANTGRLGISTASGEGEELLEEAGWLPVGADSVSIVFPGFVARLLVEGDEMRGSGRIAVGDDAAAAQAETTRALEVRLERVECRIP